MAAIGDARAGACIGDARIDVRAGRMFVFESLPLDGHESDAAELLLFDKFAARIALHREVWEQVVTKVTVDQHLQQQATIDAGFIGSREAVRRGVAEAHGNRTHRAAARAEHHRF